MGFSCEEWMQMLTKWIRCAVLLPGVLALGGCRDGAVPTTGTLVVRMTDAPFPYDSVARADLHVVRIDAKMGGAGDDEMHDVAEPDANADPRRGWVTIARPDRAYDLLQLQHGRTVDLGQETLPTGRYRSFRLILDTDRSSITLKDGRVLTGSSSPGIKWPSAHRTGVKVKLVEPIDLVEDSTVMVLDFDLGKSFVQTGNSISKGLLFKPVIRATAIDITGAVSGTVRGEAVSGPVVPGATVEVLVAGTPAGDANEANVVATTATDDTGAFTAAFLMPGSYRLRATPPAASPYGPAVLDVTVPIAGDVTGATIVVPRRAQ